MPVAFRHFLILLATYSLSASGSASAEQLTGSEWRPIELHGKPVGAIPAPGTKPIVKFSLGRVSGNGGCNSFTAAFTSSVKQDHPDYGTLNVGPILATRKFCGPGSDLENTLFKVMRNTVRYHRPASPPSSPNGATGESRAAHGLTLFAEDGAVLARFALSD